jgi:fructosamine-3-kinase
MRDDVLDALGGADSVASAESLPGGCVADVWMVTRTDGSRVVAKTVAGADDDILPIEADGLAVLRETGGLLTPRVLSATPRLLILEALSECEATAEDWAVFARSLAAMHSGTAHDLFGWSRDGYLGRLPQVNTWTADGHEFFAEHRLLRYLREPGVEAALGADDRRAVERLCDRLQEVIPRMPAVLIHGDLWAGNLLSTADGGIAVIDPAVYYAWAEIDVSMLWGSPRPPQSQRFFDVYQEQNPSPPGWRERMPVLYLRELLSMLAHFGDIAVDQAKLVRDTLAPFYRRPLHPLADPGRPSVPPEPGLPGPGVLQVASEAKVTSGLSLAGDQCAELPLRVDLTPAAGG